MSDPFHDSEAPLPFARDEPSPSSKRDIARFVFKYLPFMLVTTAAVTILTALAVFLLPQTYVSEGIVLVERAKNPTLRSDPIAYRAELDTIIRSEIEIIYSRGVAEQVIDRLGFSDDEPLRTGSSKLFESFYEALNRWGLIARLDVRERRIRGLGDALVVDQPARSDMLAIRFTHDDPVLAHRIASAIVEAYIQRHREIYSDNTANFYEQRVKQVTDELQALRTTLQRETDPLAGDPIRLQIRALEESFLFYSEKWDRARAATLSDESLVNIRIVDLPRLPLRPQHTRLFQILVGLFAGAVFALAVALLREHLDSRVYVPSDLDGMTSFPVLATVRKSRAARAYTRGRREAPQHGGVPDARAEPGAHSDAESRQG